MFVGILLYPYWAIQSFLSFWQEVIDRLCQKIGADPNKLLGCFHVMGVVELAIGSLRVSGIVVDIADILRLFWRNSCWVVGYSMVICIHVLYVCSGRLSVISLRYELLIIAPVGPLRERKLLLEDRPLRIQVLCRQNKGNWHTKTIQHCFLLVRLLTPTCGTWLRTVIPALLVY